MDLQQLQRQRDMPATMAQYRAIAERLFRQFARMSGNNWESDPMRFAAWFERRAETMKPSTVRLYRAALLERLRTHAPRELVERIQAAQGSRAVPPRTAALKLKQTPPDALLEIAEKLGQSRSRFRDVVFYMLLANSLLGLRPKEWDSAELEGDELRVRTAKFGHGRGRSGYRNIDVSPLDESLRQALTSLLDELDRLKREYSFEEIFMQARRLLLNVQKDKPRKISLYSTRHQAGDNLRQSLPKEALAVFLGHSSLQSLKHYGMKSGAFAHVPALNACDAGPEPAATLA